MLGYGYEIIYKKDKENVIIDTLSQNYEEEDSLFSMSFIVVYWLNDTCNEWFLDPTLSTVNQRIKEEIHAYLRYT